MSPVSPGSDGSPLGAVDSRVGLDGSTASPEAAMRRGDVGIFALNWTSYEMAGARRIPVGFVGVLVDTWEGWSVFGCVRDVAEAVIAEHRRDLARERARLRALGYAGSDLDARLAGSTIGMWFDGDDIVVDERGLLADPDAISRVSPDEYGRYVIRGYVWPWICVDAAICDRIVG